MRPPLTTAAPVLAVVLAAALLGGCSDGSDDDDSRPTGRRRASSSSPSDELRPRPPRPPSRWCGPGVTGEVATGLEAPWGMAFLPDGSALVTERDTDRVKLVTADGRGVATVGTVRGVDGAGEGGLLGLAVSPTYDEDQTVFAYFTAGDDNVIARMTYDGKRAAATSGPCSTASRRADPQRRPDRVRPGRLALRRHRRGRAARPVRRTRTTSAARSCG